MQKRQPLGGIRTVVRLQQMRGGYHFISLVMTPSQRLVTHYPATGDIHDRLKPGKYVLIHSHLDTFARSNKQGPGQRSLLHRAEQQRIKRQARL